MIYVRVPATSANLGPGFDCLGLALNLYNKISVAYTDSFYIKLAGSYPNQIPADENNLVWKTMCYLWKQAGFSIPKVSLILENNIPPARGLGSSSAAIVGGLLLANTLAGSPFSKDELLQMAYELEGHPDNVTPALFGGITLSIPTNKGIIPRVLVDSPEFRALAIVPDFLLKTNKARMVLSSEVTRQDAVFNISHVALLVDAFLRKDYKLLKEAMQDRLHQTQRASLIPGMSEALESALEAGAYGAALSGSGPTLLALIPPEAEDLVSAAMVKIFESHGLSAQAFSLEIDPHGAQVIID